MTSHGERALVSCFSFFFFFSSLQSFPPYLIAKSVIVPPSKWTRKGGKKNINRSSNRLTAGFWLDKRVHHGGMRCLFCGGHNGCCRLAIGFSLESIFHRHANPPMSLIRLIFFPPTILYRPRVDWGISILLTQNRPDNLARDFLKAIFSLEYSVPIIFFKGIPEYREGFLRVKASSAFEWVEVMNGLPFLF